MLSKTGSDAWLFKKTLLRNRDEFKDDIWPKLEKSKHTPRENVEETWPQLRKGTNKDVIDNKKSALDVNDGGSQRSKAIECTLMSSSSKEGNTVNSKSDELSWKEEKKQAHKMFIKTKKEVSRQEKRKEREENVLRQILGPKGLSVSLIDSETFSKFVSADHNHTSSIHLYEQESSSVNEMCMDSSAFPELSQGLIKLHTKSSRRYRNRNYLNTITGTINRDVNPPCQSSINAIRENVAVSNIRGSRKPRKKKDPVVVDILKAIEICKVDKKSSRISGEISSIKKNEKNIPRITGNLLDSSNPLRHRGKKRDVPRKRNMTRLKKTVMAERERRRTQRQINMSDSSVNICDNANQPEAKNEIILMNGEFVHPHKPHAISKEIGSECIEKIKSEPLNCDLCGNILGRSLQNLVDPKMEIVDVDLIVRETIHSKKFREYCNHTKSKELSEAVTLMLQDIIRFQDRLHVNQPIKAESHRRYVLGLRQTQNLLSVQKVKVIVMASDIEKVPSPGGLDDLVTSIIDGAKKQNVPVIFSFQRRKLGKLTYRKIGVSCVGILNYQGTEINFQRVIVALDEAKSEYLDKFGKEKSRVMNEVGLLNIKKEDVEPDVQPLKIEPVFSLPLFQKLTEAISEISLQSSFQDNPSGDAL